MPKYTKWDIAELEKNPDIILVFPDDDNVYAVYRDLSYSISSGGQYGQLKVVNKDIYYKHPKSDGWQKDNDKRFVEALFAAIDCAANEDLLGEASK